MTVIPAGQMFPGRSAGGGMRSQIYGTRWVQIRQFALSCDYADGLILRTYGSGYPGITGRGVTGRGFPFWFWPVVWTNDDPSYLGAPEVRSGYHLPTIQLIFVSIFSMEIRTIVVVLVVRWLKRRLSPTAQTQPFTSSPITALFRRLSPRSTPTVLPPFHPLVPPHHTHTILPLPGHHNLNKQYNTTAPVALCSLLTATITLPHSPILVLRIHHFHPVST